MTRSVSNTPPPCIVTVKKKDSAALMAMAVRMGTRMSGRTNMMSAGRSAHGEMTKLSSSARNIVSSTAVIGLRNESTV